jgi:hypothetical protein
LELHFGIHEKNSFHHIVVFEHKLTGILESDPEKLHAEYTLERNILAWKLLEIKRLLRRHGNKVAKWRKKHG